MDGALDRSAPTLTTARLSLRPLERKDAEPFAQQLSTWDVAKWLAVPPWPFLRQDADAFVEAVLMDPGDRTALLRTITMQGDDEAIGMVSIGHDGPVFTLGYWLGEAHWGRGLMTEAVGAVLAHHFRIRPEVPVMSGVFEGNEASLRVQQKLGFRVVGVSRVYCRPRRQELTHVDTRLDRPAFEGRQS